MAKKSGEVAELQAQLEQKEKALSEARKGLFRIIDIHPATYGHGPAGSGQTLPIVTAFREAQSVADATVLKMSDAEDS